MAWQTVAILLTVSVWVIAKFSVLCEMLTPKYKKLHIILLYAVVELLLRGIRQYVRFNVVDFNIPYFQYIVDIFNFMLAYVFLRFTCKDRSVKIALFMVSVWAVSTLNIYISLFLHYIVFSRHVIVTFTETHTLYGVMINVGIQVLILFAYLLIWKKCIGSIKQDIPNAKAFLFAMGGQLVVITYYFDILFEAIAPPMLVIGSSILIAGNIVILQVILTNSKKKEADENLRQLQHIRELEQVHYTELEARRHNIAKIQHDFNNQLTIAYQLIATNAKGHVEKLLNQLKNSIDSTKEYSYCQNAIVNAVLIEKQKDCNLEDIALETNIEIGDRHPVSQIHLCSIFTNLLDNSIEASKLVSQEHRKIEIRTAVKGDYLHIKCVNAVACKLEKEQSRKGYGKIILSDIANHYNGNFTSEIVGDRYVALISLQV